jgi:hypothetical protein
MSIKVGGLFCERGDKGRMEGEFITVEMSVTNYTKGYKMRCTPIIMAEAEASRNKNTYEEYAQRNIEL